MSEEIMPDAQVRMALTGCVFCGLVFEVETEITPGHLSIDVCPDCGQRLRVVDLAEANQLTEERFLASHWREISAANGVWSARITADYDLAPRQALAGRRRSVLRREQFDSDPRELRATLAEVDRLLAGCEPGLRRRIRLVFGELVARWQDGCAGDAISTVIEIVPGEVRVHFSNPDRTLAPSDWEGLISASIRALAVEWGVDRRIEGGAWFRFQPDRDN
jgi:hypothetical protein